jgi:hypothetical protein
LSRGAFVEKGDRELSDLSTPLSRRAIPEKKNDEDGNECRGLPQYYAPEGPEPYLVPDPTIEGDV